MVPTLPDTDSQSRQLFGLLVEECGDPRYGSVSKTKGQTICRTLRHPYSIIQGARYELMESMRQIYYRIDIPTESDSPD